MTDQTQAPPAGYFDRLKARRRKAVRRFGMYRIRDMAGFISRQSIVEDTPVLDRAHFPFVDAFEAQWEDIRRELDSILKYREAIPFFQELAPDQKKIAKGENWRTYVMFGFGTKHEKNCARAPITASLLEKVPNLQTAWFSILAPRYHIPPHRGVTKGIIRCHVGLKVPTDRDRCYIRIVDQNLHWREGEAFVFDDTYDHEVLNDTDEERVVLIFDFDRPMRFWGRLLNRCFVAALKRTSYYTRPKKNLPALDARFEAAVERANALMEGYSDKDEK